MDQASSNVSGKGPLVFLGIVIILLILSAVISFRAGPLRSSFNVEEALICQELDGAHRPLKVGNSIPYGARQVCLWLKYTSAREGSYLEVSWYYENDLILSERVGLTVKDGERAFYLLQEEGSPLPAGNYAVVISTAARLRSEISFHIDK